MPALTLPVNRGAATGIDKSLLKPGELSEAEGVVYKRGDPAAHKYPGRTSFATPTAATAVNGLRFVSFDTGTDYLLAQSGGTLKASTTTGASFATSTRTGLTATATMLDAIKYGDALFMCNGTDTNWVVKNDATSYRQSLTAQTVPPTGSSAGAGLTGTFVYWATEYDSTNGVESAVAATGATYSITVTDDTITVTKPATLNTSATHWRLYRTKDTGSFPVGWLVATTAIGTTTFADATTDAALVLLTPYATVQINGALEGRNQPAGIFRSITAHEGSLVGCADRTTYWSETGTPHYFPTSYAVTHRPLWGGQARCVRSVGGVVLTFFDHETFRLNYLPKESDSTFDGGVAQERIGFYGTPSPLGACVFSGWGGSEMVFVASRSGPMLTNGDAFDYAVRAIDWSGTVPATSLATCVCIDNPDAYRVEMYFLDSASDWRCLHFYYDSTRIEAEGGFPELAWTGPHLVPGPGTFGIISSAGRVWTGSRDTADGAVYNEGVGVEDAADLVDSSGTINFRLRTQRVYPGGVGGEGVVDEVHIHKASAGSGTYTTTLTAIYDNADSVASSRSISATVAGATSETFTAGGQAFDVRIVRDDAAAMPAINNVTAVLSSLTDLAQVGD